MKQNLIRLLAVCLCAVLLVACGGAANWIEQYDLGMRYLSEENYQEAILAFTEAIGVDPNRAELYIRRAGAYVYSGETADNLAAALADYEAAKELDSADANLWLGLADLYIRQGEMIKALETLEEGLEATGGNEEVQAKIDEIKSGNVTDSQGRLRGHVGFDEAGQVAWFHAVRYNGEMQESAIIRYDENGNEQDRVEVLYDGQGRKVQNYSYNMDDGSLIRMEYTYDEAGNWARESMFPLNGGQALTWVNSFDEAGNKVRSEQYSEEGTLMNTQVFGWNEETGWLDFEETYSAQGDLQMHTDYIRDAQGRAVRTEVTGPDGELISFVITEYRGDISFSTGYDADGNVLYSVEQ